MHGVSEPEHAAQGAARIVIDGGCAPVLQRLVTFSKGSLRWTVERMCRYSGSVSVSVP